MSRIVRPTFVVMLALVVTLTCQPSEANWFGKRGAKGQRRLECRNLIITKGNKDDIFDLFIRQSQLDRSKVTREMDFEPALSLYRVLRSENNNILTKLANPDESDVMKSYQ